jgi:hypothetical protein
MMFKTHKDVSLWLLEDQNQSHPHWKKCRDESFLMMALERRLHKHSLKETFIRGLRENVPIPPMIRAMHGDEAVGIAEAEAAESAYKGILEKLRRDWDYLPKDVTEMMDLETETMICDHDKQLYLGIENCINECNRLIYYEL